MTRIRWHLVHLLRSLGWPGRVAALVLLGAAGAWFVAVAPLQGEIAKLEAATAADERRVLAAGSPAPRASTPADQLAAFESRFTREQDMSSALVVLGAVAKKRGLRLEQAEFKFVNESSEPVQRYSIALPVKADYRSLRGFIRDALRELPGMAMEELNLRRTDPKSTLLDAQVRFVLFVRKPG